MNIPTQVYLGTKYGLNVNIYTIMKVLTTAELTTLNDIVGALTIFGYHCGLTQEDIVRLRTSAVMKDRGNMLLPDGLLAKQGPFTGTERRVMQEHTGHSVYLKEQEFKDSCVSSDLLSHHENWDGSGYPNRSSGLEIPLFSRMMAIIDGYLGMRASRNYRHGLSKADTLGKLEKLAGAKYDPTLLNAFLPLVESSVI